MILLVIGALMGLSALLLVTYPLFGIDQSVASVRNPRSGQGSDAVAGDMSERESAARQALADVDFDYHLGNLDDEDYSQLRDRYEESALVALKDRYERELALDEVIGRQLATLKAEDERKAPVNPAREGRRTAARTARPATAGRTGAPAAGEGRRRRRKGVS